MADWISHPILGIPLLSFFILFPLLISVLHTNPEITQGRLRELRKDCWEWRGSGRVILSLSGFALSPPLVPLPKGSHLHIGMPSPTSETECLGWIFLKKPTLSSLLNEDESSLRLNVPKFCCIMAQDIMADPLSLGRYNNAQLNCLTSEVGSTGNKPCLFLPWEQTVKGPEPNLEKWFLTLTVSHFC